MQEITSLSAKKMAELIKNKKLSCVEVMQAHLDRIAKVNPLINAIVEQLPPDQALKQAKIADEAIASNKPLGKLHGVPITIKQARKVKGFPCNFGVESPMNFVAKEDSTLVARLRAEGPIIIGVTNIPDFSMTYETDNSLYGCTHNPYDLKRSPGGSSGGEAAIIAAGGSALGIGADAGGSIRQPAHNCGIAGLKPTRGLLPSTGIFPENGQGFFNHIDVQGPMARYTEDLNYVLPILAGHDHRDANIFPIPVGNAEKVDLKSLRILFYTNNGVGSPTADVCDTVNSAAKALSKEVANMKEQYPKISAETYTSFEELYFYGGDRGQWLHDRMKKMGVKKVAQAFQALLDRAQQCEFSVTELRHRFHELEKFKYMMMDYFHDHDVIICPPASTPANYYPPLPVEKTATPTGKTLDLALDLTYNFPYNIMGWPAAVVRCGTSKEGLPIGVQIIAKQWRDDIALAVAKRLEEIFGGWQPTKL